MSAIQSFKLCAGFLWPVSSFKLSSGWRIGLGFTQSQPQQPNEDPYSAAAHLSSKAVGSLLTITFDIDFPDLDMSPVLPEKYRVLQQCHVTPGEKPLGRFLPGQR
jgi:hypothetical protein